MRTFALKLMLLAAAALLAGLWLLPAPGEVALMAMKSHDYRSALEHYQREYRDGNRSPSVVVPFSRLQLQFGQAEPAVQLVRELAAAHSGDPEAWKTAAAVYRLAGRPLSLIAALQKHTALQPAAENLQELADLYRLHGVLDEERRVLERLVEQNAAGSGEYCRLAELLAETGNASAAAGLLEQLAAVHSPEFGYAELKSYLAYAGSTNDSSRAEALVRQYLAYHPGSEAQAAAGSLLLSAGRAELALRIVGDLERVRGEEPLLTLYASGMIRLGRGAELLQQLWPVWVRGELPPPLTTLLADLVLAEQENPRLDDFLKQASLAAIDASLVFRIVRVKLAQAGMAERRAWGERLMREVPLRTAALQILADYLTGAFKAEPALLSAVERESLQPDERELLLGVLHAAGDRRLSLALAATLSDPGLLSEQGVLDLATVLIDGNQSGGWRLLEESRTTRPSPRIDRLWLLETLRAGRHAPALAWLRQHPAQPRQTLLDAFSIAVTHKSADAALALANLLNEADPGPQSTLCMARALRLAGRLPESLNLYRQLEASPEVEHERLASLAALARTHPSYRDELRAALEAEITRNVSRTRRKEAAFIALEDLKDKKLAEVLFMELAEGAEPSSPEINQLLYLWGPRPPAAGLRWLEKRFQEAPPAQQPGWLAVLYRVGDEQYADAAAKERLERLTAPVQLSFLQSRAAAGDVKAVEDGFRRVLKSAKDRAHLSALAAFARAHSYRALLAEALRAGAAAKGVGSAERELALAAFEEANYAEAAQHFAAYLQAENETVPADPELYLMHFKYAEALEQLGNHNDSQKHLLRTLSLLNSNKVADGSSQVVRATVLGRLGRKEEAAEVMKQVLKNDPHNLQIRSMLANLLVELRRYQEAHVLLFGK